MTKNCFLNYSKSFLVIITVFFSSCLFAQQNDVPVQLENQFWRNVQFGGGIGLGFGSGYTDISVAPSVIYNFNEYVALGVGLQYKYLKQKDFYASHLYGGSAIGFFNPLHEIQLSAELEQLRVNVNLDGSNSNSENYWNTALFIGAGYRSGNATIGVRYNVLTDKNNIYGSAFMPFIRFYF
ncbi:hypothetical protein IWX83_000492 [Flavobacterium sp. CG_9.1]|uniref:Alpha-ketoglutarate decarboxylase n=1 Tax=Flavobacterium xanthum TaxID=69322 RepID=A0A1M7IRE7_9FLAO|nr:MULTISPECIES: hypothetical protein [Flavobacterium]MBG6060720.1 hypothetical protein [Flavobacterium sp. CG_9.1]SHM43259.1 hypothetical protein SAMN05443669_103613 [Flavobacterium xanthum]